MIACALPNRARPMRVPEGVMTLDRRVVLAQSLVILRCALLRASKDEKRPWPILRGSLCSHLPSERKCVRPGMTARLLRGDNERAEST
jgi:hypothetical protein